MFAHGPSVLSGPVTRARGWWHCLAWNDLPGAQPGGSDPGPDPAAADRPIRADLVERVRREIAAGTYDTPQKWDAALERLFRRLSEP